MVIISDARNTYGYGLRTFVRCFSFWDLQVTHVHPTGNTKDGHDESSCSQFDYNLVSTRCECKVTY